MTYILIALIFTGADMDSRYLGEHKSPISCTAAAKAYVEQVKVPEKVEIRYLCVKRRSI